MILLRALIVSALLAAAAPALALAQPDLSGHWSNATSTLLERDARFGERLTMTEEEASALPRGSGAMVSDGKERTSFLVAPADGQLPDLTPLARAKLEDRRAEFPRGLGFGRGDNPESMTYAERCLRDFGSSLGPPMMPVGYNNTYQIVQTPDHVMILVEMIHDARIVPINGKHRPDAIRSWMGDSIGRYEGDTLVVETTNFRPGLAFRGAPEDVTLIERFTRVSDTQILYAFEINEPEVFTAPIRAEIALNAVKGPVLEYACHEGNYSFGNQLQTQRLAEASN
jgi:hypothetical protein